MDGLAFVRENKTSTRFILDAGRGEVAVHAGVLPRWRGVCLEAITDADVVEWAADLRTVLREVDDPAGG